MNYYPSNFYQNYQPPQGLQGKMVESKEIVKISEIPFGSYGVFPRSDLGEIYIKTWNNNGTTKVITYKPVDDDVQQPQEPTTEDIILEKIQAIEEKINNLSIQKVEPPKKEVKLNNAY